jgi:hypothetical protein
MVKVRRIDGIMTEPTRPSPNRDTRDLGGTLSEGGRRGDPDPQRQRRDPRLKGGGGGVERKPGRDPRR